MKIRDLDFIEIKTKRSPTANALRSITNEKLKPYYNTVYQLLQLKNPTQKKIHQVSLQIEQKIIKNMPKMVFDRRVGQQTLEFKIIKPLQKKHFSNETQSSRKKKCRSVTKAFSLSKSEHQRHQQKDNFSQKFDTLRKMTKTFSQSTLQQKKKYNLFQKWHKIVDNHYQSLELEPRFLPGQKEEQNMIAKTNQNRFKIQANLYKWVENTLISNDSEHVSLVRQEKSKYFRQKGQLLNEYKGVNQQQVKECQQIIEQDPTLLNFSLNHTIQTTSVSQVKSIFEVNKSKLNHLMIQYKTTRSNSPIRPSPRKTKSLDRSLKLNIRKNTCHFQQYEKYKETQNESPESFQIGDRYSNFRSKQDKVKTLTKLKEHQKAKYTTKVMDLNMHRKLFLKEK